MIGEGAPWALANGGAAQWLAPDWQGTIGDAPRDPWGAPLSGGAPGPQLGYRGELELDGDTWLRHRIYRPASRTFHQPDPLMATGGERRWRQPVRVRREQPARLGRSARPAARHRGAARRDPRPHGSQHLREGRRPCRRRRQARRQVRLRQRRRAVRDHGRAVADPATDALLGSGLDRPGGAGGGALLQPPRVRQPGVRPRRDRAGRRRDHAHESRHDQRGTGHQRVGPQRVPRADGTDRAGGGHVDEQVRGAQVRRCPRAQGERPPARAGGGRHSRDRGRRREATASRSTSTRSTTRSSTTSTARGRCGRSSRHRRTPDGGRSAAHARRHRRPLDADPVSGRRPAGRPSPPGPGLAVSRLDDHQRCLVPAGGRRRVRDPRRDRDPDPARVRRPGGARRRRPSPSGRASSAGRAARTRCGTATGTCRRPGARGRAGIASPSTPRCGTPSRATAPSSCSSRWGS